MYREGQHPVNRVTGMLTLLILAMAGVQGASGQSADGLDASRRDEADLARAIGFVSDGNLDAAEEVLDAAGDIADEDPRWLNLRGLVAAGRGDPGTAVRHYEAGLRADPGMAALHRNLAISLVALHARGRALTEFLQATELDPTDAEAWLGLCHLQNELHRYDDAALALERLERLAPEDVRTGWVRAELADARGTAADQLAAWSWLDARAANAETARRLGRLSEDPAAQLGYFRTCVDRDSSAVDCREQVTRLEFMLGDAEAAVRASAGALMQLTEAGYLNLLVAAANSSGIPKVEGWVERRPPQLPGSWLVVASIRRDLGDPKAAMTAIRTGLGLAETADLYNLLGVLEVEAGDPDAARLAWHRALEIDPGHGPARANLEEHPPRP